MLKSKIALILIAASAAFFTSGCGGGEAPIGSQAYDQQLPSHNHQ